MDDPSVSLFDYISFMHAVASIELTLVISPSAALAALLVALLPPFFVCVGPLKPTDDFTFLVDSGFWPFDRKARPLEDPTAVRGIWTDAHGLPDRTKKRTKAADSRGIIKHTRYQLSNPVFCSDRAFRGDKVDKGQATLSWRFLLLNLITTTTVPD